MNKTQIQCDQPLCAVWFNNGHNGVAQLWPNTYIRSRLSCLQFNFTMRRSYILCD